MFVCLFSKIHLKFLLLKYFKTTPESNSTHSSTLNGPKLINILMVSTI